MDLNAKELAIFNHDLVSLLNSTYAFDDELDNNHNANSDDQIVTEKLIMPLNKTEGGLKVFFIF